MTKLTYKNGEAFLEDLSLSKIAKTVDTPSYLYSARELKKLCKLFKQAFASYPTKICYAVKANSNMSILKAIFSEGFGADIVSLGELEKAVLAGVDPSQLVFSGVGKKEAEIQRALDLGILSFNVESFFELELIQKICKERGCQAPVSLRLNPDIDAKTHPKIATGLHSTKFGISMDQLDKYLHYISQHERELKLIGLACHIGSQITDMAPLSEAASIMLALTKDLAKRGFDLEYLNLGGGLGIQYTDEDVPSIEDYARTLIKPLQETKLKLIIEPGRALVGETGGLLTKVLGLKETPEKSFLIVDAAMNDLLRPTLYNSEHKVFPASDFAKASSDKSTKKASSDKSIKKASSDKSIKKASSDKSTKASSDKSTKASSDKSTKASSDKSTKASSDKSTKASSDKHQKIFDIVGPICETGDFLAKNRLLPSDIKAGDYLFIDHCGAYAASMASNYNMRPKAAEILIEGESYRIISKRQELEDLWKCEL